MGRGILDFNNYQLTVIMKVIHSILSFSPSIALSQAIVCILLAFSPAAYSKISILAKQRR